MVLGLRAASHWMSSMASVIRRLSDAVPVRYGSRVAQPRRVRRFIEQAVKRLADRVEFVLGAKELRIAHAKGMAELHGCGASSAREVHPEFLADAYLAQLAG